MMTKRQNAVLASTLALLFFAGGCANKAQSGAGVGALGGALAGSLLGPSKNKEQNALIGAAVGGLIGYAVGNEMDKADQAKVSNVLETGTSNQTKTWRNPDTGNEYAVTPYPARAADNGEICRDAQIDAVINGRKEKTITQACRAPDGRWELRPKG